MRRGGVGLADAPGFFRRQVRHCESAVGPEQLEPGRGELVPLCQAKRRNRIFFLTVRYFVRAGSLPYTSTFFPDLSKIVSKVPLPVKLEASCRLAR